MIVGMCTTCSSGYQVDGVMELRIKLVALKYIELLSWWYLMQRWDSFFIFSALKYRSCVALKLSFLWFVFGNFGL